MFVAVAALCPGSLAIHDLGENPADMNLELKARHIECFVRLLYDCRIDGGEASISVSGVFSQKSINIKSPSQERK